MNYKYLLLALLAAASLFAGCKKSEKDTTPYLSGNVKFTSLPKYVMKGETYHIVATGAYRGSDPADSLVGYYLSNPVEVVYDTMRVENLDAVAETDLVITKDSLASFTLTVYAFAKGYYSASKYTTFTIVNPSLKDGSLTGHPFGESVTATMQDARDSRTYYTISSSDGKVWMAQNLAYAGTAEEALGIPYQSSAAMSYIFGRYYTWNEAKTACPAGWRLPTAAEFASLVGAGSSAAQSEGTAPRFKADMSFNGSVLWPYQNATIKTTNESGFSAIPVGFLSISGDQRKFSALGERAVFWTSDTYADDSEFAYARYLLYNSNDVFVTRLHKESVAASVRCVKE